MFSLKFNVLITFQTFKDSHKDWVISQKLVPFRFGKFKINIELPNSCGWNHGFRDVQLDCVSAIIACFHCSLTVPGL